MSDSKSKRRSKADIARENGSKSKGAITPEGKLRAATASLVHGLTSKSVVLANECPHKYEGLRQSFFDEWQPAGITEEGYVTQMANAYWRLCRVWAIETGLLDSALFGKTRGVRKCLLHLHRRAACFRCRWRPQPRESSQHRNRAAL